MEVYIVSVAKPKNVVKNGKSWDEVEVQFIGKNGPGKRSIKSFEGEVYKQVQTLSEGDAAEVTVVKNGQYWNWTEVVRKAGAQSSNGNSAAASGGNGKKGDWETAEERAARQIYIVRQSSISSAIEYLKSVGDADDITIDGILFAAAKFEDFVFNGLPNQKQAATSGNKAKAKAKEPAEAEEMQ